MDVSSFDQSPSNLEKWSTRSFAFWKMNAQWFWHVFSWMHFKVCASKTLLKACFHCWHLKKKCILNCIRLWDQVVRHRKLIICNFTAAVEKHKNANVFKCIQIEISLSVIREENFWVTVDIQFLNETINVTN